MMDWVQLTDGRIGRSELGRTLIHEHVHLGMPGWQFDAKSPRYVRQELMARAIDKLQELRGYGCGTIVDPCPMDLGRDVEFVAEAAQRSGINVICATGVYHEAEGIPYTLRTMPREDIVALYVKELTEGVGETGIKAGVIKIASGGNPDNVYDRQMIGVAAEVSRLTGAPLISHTDLATHGHAQVDTVEENGGCASCMVVGHSGDRDDSPYQISLAQRGAFVGLDRFGLDMILPDELRMKNLMEMVAAGYRDNVLISQDAVVCLLGRVGPLMDELQPNWTISHIFERILPRLREQGLSDEDIDAILIDNPRRLFANAALQVSSAQTAQVA
jgi:phosphotriesterase-related protein